MRSLYGIVNGYVGTIWNIGRLRERAVNVPYYILLTRNSDKYIQQGIADGIFYLLQKWPGVNGSGNISARKIGMWAMQIMLDMMKDLMNKIAREEAMILE